MNHSPPNDFRCRVLDNERLTEHIYRLTLESSPIALGCKPGQFVMIRTSSSLDPLLRRPFSIHRVLSDDSFQILYRIVGKGTTNLSRVTRDDILAVIGPLGNFFQLPSARDSNTGICLVAGGMGVAPLLFLAETALRQCPRNPIIVFIGARSEEELVASTSFRSLGLETYEISDDGSCGRQGVVCDLFPLLDLTKQWKFFGCGPTPMLRALASYCSHSHHLCEISLETMMACGLGACLGCVTPRRDDAGYWHVCKDGPVFNLEVLPW